MSTQTAALPDGTKLTKPASGERVSLSVINTNTDNIANNIITLDNKIESVAITNQYSTVLAAINAYRTTKKLPFAINKNGTATFTDLPEGISTTCEWNVICFGTSTRIVAYLTVYTGGSSKNGWTFTANMYNGEYIRGWFSVNEDLETKIPSTAKICINYSNGTQYTFPVTKTNAGAYSYFLLVGGSSSTNGFVYHGFIHVSGNYATWLTLIGGTAVPGISASYDGTNLVITVTNTQYGGLRLIWLG